MMLVQTKNGVVADLKKSLQEGHDRRTERRGGASLTTKNEPECRR